MSSFYLCIGFLKGFCPSVFTKVLITKRHMTRYVLIIYTETYNINFQLRENYEFICGQNLLCDGCNWLRSVYIGGLPVSRILHQLCSGPCRNIILVSQPSYSHTSYNLSYPLSTRHLLLFSCTSSLGNVEEREREKRPAN